MAYLLEHPNPNAPGRSDGRYWGHPSRRGHTVAVGVIHTAENLPDFTPPDTGAESIARYFTTSTRPASYHDVVDSDSWIELLPGDHVAFGSKHTRESDGASWNNIGHHVSMATRAGSWGQVPDWWKPAIMDNAARSIAAASIEHNLPIVLCNRAQAHSGMEGWTTHAYLDPDRRSDPGMTDAELRDLLELADRHATGDVGIDPGDVVARVPVAGTYSSQGRWPILVVTADGRVAAANGARWLGDLWQLTPNDPRRPAQLNAPIVTAIPHRSGYYLIGGDGGVFAFGVPWPGSLGSLRLAAPIVGAGIVPDTDSGHRRLVLTAEDGGTFALGSVE